MKTKRVFAGLGVVAALAASALPLSSYAVSGTVGVDFTVGSTLSMTIDGGANGKAISIDGINSGDTVRSSEKTHADSSKQTSRVAVSTNNATGYNLVASVPNGGSLTHDKGTNPISMTAGGSSISESEAWGIHSYSDGWNDYLAFSAGTGVRTAIVKNQPSNVSNDTTELEYTLKTDASTPSGTYSTTVTYIATANN